MPRRILDLTLPCLAENLALDEALLLDAEAGTGDEVVRFWEWPSLAVVLGASGRVEEEVDRAACLRDAVPIQRRASGGGTVLLGTGCLVFSLVLDMEKDGDLKDIHASYRAILGRLTRALGPVAVTTQQGISDLAIGEMKISGSAQQRKRRFLLHHGTLLCRFEIAGMARYLRQPNRQPTYRADRPHDLFAANLRADSNEMKQLIADAWETAERFDKVPLDLTAQLLSEKYSRDDWVNRR